MNKKLVFLSFACIAFLAGCGHPYQIRPLKHVKKTEAQFIEKKDNIELRVKKLSKEEIKQIFNGRYFGDYVTSLIITIKNDSLTPITFGQENISLNLLSAQQIHAHFRKTIVGKIFLGILAIPVVVNLLLWGSLFFVSSMGILTFQGGVPCGLNALAYLLAAECCIGVPVIIGATGSTIHNTIKFNQELSHDINRKILSTLSIAPKKKESVLLFTKNLPETFTITLLKEQQPVLFAIILNNQITK